MVQLQAAKCPQCGADIQVNPNLEQAMCQYCGTTILVNDAVEKYKIEISGKVKVDGVTNRDDLLSQAKKHFAVGEYINAKEHLHEIISTDNFDIEAYCELIKNNIELVKSGNYNPYISIYHSDYNKDYANDFKEIIDTYDRLIKIDSEETYKNYLANYMEDISNYIKINTERTQAIDLGTEIINKLVEDRKSSYSEECGDQYYAAIRDAFKLNKVFYYQKNAMPMYTDSEGYSFSEIKEVYTDGTFLASYSKMFGNLDIGYHHDHKNLYFNPKEFANNYNELVERFNNYKEIYDKALEKAKEKNKKIKKIKMICKIIAAVIIVIIILKLFVIK